MNSLFRQYPFKTHFFSLIGFGFFVSIFPWIFGYQGEILGHKVSIRALGDVIGAGLVFLGIAGFFSRRVPDGLQRLAIQIETCQQKDFRTLLLVFTSLFSFGAISHKLRAHAMVSTHAFDLGFFSNICWNTSQGNWFFSSVLERNFLGIHANWILWPLSFLYNVKADAQWLLIAQVLFMASAAPLLGLTVRRITDSACIALISVMMFVCSPYFLHSLFNDFHPDAWQMPFLMAGLWAYISKRPYYLIFFSLVALFAKEDVSVVLGGFSLFLLFQPRWRLAGVVLLISSSVIFIIQTLVIIPTFLENSQQSLLLGRYALGNSFSEIALTFFTKPQVVMQTILHEPVKYWRFLNYFFPAGGLTLLAPIFTIPCVASALPHLLSQAGTQLSLADIYSMPSQPFVFVGAAAGLMKLMKKDWFSEKIYRWAGICFFIAGLGVINSPRTFRTLSNERLAAFQELDELIPRNASLAAQQNIYPHFDTRRYIQLFPMEAVMPGLQRHVLLNPDYVVCDRIGNALPFDGEKLRLAISELEQAPTYEKIFEKENFIVFRRRNTETMRWALLS